MKTLRAVETLATALLAWAVLAPLLRIFGRTLSDPGTWRLLVTPDGAPMREALRNSLAVSVATGVLCTALGTAWAVWVARDRFPGHRLASVAPLLPLTLPPLVGVMAFLFLFGDVGLLQGVVETLRPGTRLPVWEGFGAVLLLHVYSFVPLSALLLQDGVASLSADLHDAASGLGAGRLARVRHVWIPQLGPALAGSAWLAFMGSMASFSAPYLLGGGTRFLSTEIVARRLGGELELAYLETVLLAGTGLALLALRPRTAFRTAARPLRTRHPARAWVHAIASGGLFLGLLLPHATLGLLGFVEDGSWTWQPLPPAYTWDNHLRIFTDGSATVAVRNSLAMAAPAALLGAAWALAVGRMEVLGPRRLRGLAAIAGSVAWAVPATALALAWLEAYNRPGWAGFGLTLTSTPWLLPLAYCLRFLPLQSRAVVAALATRGAVLERVATTLGASAWGAATQVTWPVVRRPLLSATALVLVLGLGEFVVSILLYVPDNRPVSLEILSELRLFHLGQAAALGVWLSLLMGLVVALVPSAGSAWSDSSSR